MIVMFENLPSIHRYIHGQVFSKSIFVNNDNRGINGE